MLVTLSDESLSNLFNAAVDSFVRLSKFASYNAYSLTTEGRRDMSEDILFKASAPLVAVSGFLSEKDKKTLDISLWMIERLQDDLTSGKLSRSQRRRQSKLLVVQSREYKRLVKTTSNRIIAKLATHGADAAAWKLREQCDKKLINVIDLVRYMRRVITQGDTAQMPSMPTSDDDEDYITEVQDTVASNERVEQMQLHMADCVQAITPERLLSAENDLVEALDDDEDT